ncbi:hypothetical protein ACTWPT_45185 [Nonomuraea sp. 3N208]|uniref:hypothetical protein n=1 Tax=Nonomuraea sp. 3N208 TaxID=3457421 RepID=UPI003FD6962E
MSTAADGTFTVTNRPPVGGQVRFTVLWNGNGDFRWSSASATAAVRYPSSLTLTGPTPGIGS